MDKQNRLMCRAHQLVLLFGTCLMAEIILGRALKMHFVEHPGDPSGQIDGVAFCDVMRKKELRLLSRFLIIETVNLETLTARLLKSRVDFRGNESVIGRARRKPVVVQRLKGYSDFHAHLWFQSNACNEDRFGTRDADRDDPFTTHLGSTTQDVCQLLCGQRRRRMLRLRLRQRCASRPHHRDSSLGKMDRVADSSKVRVEGLWMLIHEMLM